jgi:NitT/TauT family transport system substrate-binding protein
MKRAVFTGGVIAAGLTAKAGAQTAPSSPLVHVAMPPIDAASQAYYARDKGFFKKVGLNVQILIINEGASVAAGVAGGTADIGQANLASLCSAHERGLPFVAIAGANTYNAKTHQSELVVGANSPHHKASDLNGKLVAVAGLKNVQEVGFNKWMDVSGGDWKSVKMVEVPFSAMTEAVATGRVDAAMMAEPELNGALASKRVRILSAPFESIGKEFVLGIWFTTSGYAKAHPDVVKAFAQAMAMAADWANHNQTESAKILETSTGVPVAANASRVLFANRLDVAQMQPLIDASAKYGALKTTFPASDLMVSNL